MTLFLYAEAQLLRYDLSWEIAGAEININGEFAAVYPLLGYVTFATQRGVRDLAHCSCSRGSWMGSSGS